jgi:hypothetical protein
MQNNIDTMEGLHDELKQIMEEFRAEHHQITMRSFNKPISQQLNEDQELFTKYRNRVFDVVHASCALERV